MQDEYEMFKIVVIGSSGTGKTNISTRFMRDQFQETSQATLGVQFLNKMVELNNKKIKISLWDTAGQERYKALSKVYYKGASGVIVVYDITDAKSYLDLQSWMRLVNQNLNLEDIVIMVVGNKADLEQERQVPAHRPQQEYYQNFGIDCWQVSAKTGHKINELFNEMITKILQKASENIKGTVYRGTTEYASERGTLIRPEKQNVIANRTSSIILEDDEEMKSVTNEQPFGKAEANNNKGYGANRMTLTVGQHKQKEKENKENKKKKKCC